MSEQAVPHTCVKIARPQQLLQESTDRTRCIEERGYCEGRVCCEFFFIAFQPLTLS